jgi:coenzyme F420-reducing hydrogenase gamma subunit
MKIFFTSKRKKILATLSVLVIVFGYFLVPQLSEYIRYKKAAKAASSFPTILGLTKVVMVPCVVTLGVCVGGTTCNTKPPGACTAYTEVTGVPAGETGNLGLFLTTSLGTAGVTPGGSLIAGGISPVLMDSGVVAGFGGCFGQGCITKRNIFDKAEELVDKYFVAIFKK